MTWGARSREKNFPQTPTELVSSDRVKSQHRWLKMQHFPPSCLVAVECRSLIHDLELRGYRHVCVCMWGGLLKHISVNFIFIRALPQLLEDPTIKTIFFLALKYWWRRRDGARERGWNQPSLSASMADWTTICDLSAPAGAVRGGEEKRCHFDNAEF